MNKFMISVSGLVIAFMLSGCNSDNNPQVIGSVYQTVQECSSEYPYNVCEEAYNTALKDTIQNSVKYETITDCTNLYGVDGCANVNNPTVSTQDQYPGDKFIPKFQGFSVLVNYEPEYDDDDDDETGDYYPVYGSTGYVYQPYFFYMGSQRPYVIAGGTGYSSTSKTSIFTSRINNKTIATTGVKVGNTYVKPSETLVKTSISRSGFGSRSFSSSKSFSVSRGGFGGKAGGFGGGRGG